MNRIFNMISTCTKLYVVCIGWDWAGYEAMSGESPGGKLWKCHVSMCQKVFKTIEATSILSYFESKRSAVLKDVPSKYEGSGFSQHFIPSNWIKSLFGRNAWTEIWKDNIDAMPHLLTFLIGIVKNWYDG